MGRPIACYTVRCSTDDPTNDMARGDPQTNIRLTPERYAILEAAAFVHRAGTPTKLVEQLVDEAIDRYAKLPTVQKALEAQREQGAADEGKLSHLATKRRRTSTGSAGGPA
jgi:Fe2+ or Zn2+ uptake regulation protein